MTGQEHCLCGRAVSYEQGDMTPTCRPCHGSPDSCDCEPLRDVLAPIRVAEKIEDQAEREIAVAEAVRELAGSGALDEVSKLKLKSYVTGGKLLKPADFNAIVREAGKAQQAKAGQLQLVVAGPDADQIAAALLDLGDQPGAEALNRAAAFVGPYLALPSEHCLTVMTLWAAHTYAVHKFYVTPRLIFDSAEPESGKSRALELLFLICYSPKMTISITTAALYRRLAKAGHRAMTVLFDETDAIFNPRTAPQYEDLRALLNAGYKRGATVDRCVGDGASMDVKEFPVFAPVALAGLAGHMPATITTRAAAEVHMRKRAPSETVQPYDEHETAAAAAPVRDALAAWIESVSESLGAARPEMPEGVADRPAENWRPLLAIADAAGSGWPERARAACRYFVLGSEHKESFGVRLLRDMRQVFTTFLVVPAVHEDEEPARIPVGFTDKLASTEILRRLTAMEDSPWADIKGKPLDANRISDELKRYQVEKGLVRIPDEEKPGKTKPAKGYHVTGDGGLADAWLRYLPGHAAYLQRDPRGYTGYSGSTTGRGGSAHDGAGSAGVTAVTLDEACQDSVTAGGVTRPGAVTAESAATSAGTGVTPVTAKGRNNPEPVSGLALLERELGAREGEPSPNGHRDRDCCPQCGSPYGSPAHAFACRGYHTEEEVR